MKTLIIGAGEIGKSLQKVLSAKHEVFIRDKEDNFEVNDIEVLNICYPYHSTFIDATKAYIKRYNPKLTIIHSTVAPGTTRKCGEKVVHSPCHGKHPNLEGGIKTFVKYIGGTNTYALNLADKFLHDAGIKVMVVSSPESSELSKILCTTQYGVNIMMMKEIARICDEWGVPFKEVYSHWNGFYNQGYEQLGMPQFRRYILEPMEGRTGGHCVINNTYLLDDWLTNLVKDRDEEINKKK